MGAVISRASLGASGWQHRHGVGLLVAEDAAAAQIELPLHQQIGVELAGAMEYSTRAIRPPADTLWTSFCSTSKEPVASTA